jgi:hypothetical protein
MSLFNTIKMKFLQHKPYITKQQLKELLIKARLQERSRTEREWQEKYDYDMARAEREKEIAVTEKNAEISLYKKDLAEKDAHIKTIESVYDTCWEQIKINAALGAELRIYVEKAQHVQSDIYRNIQQIVDRARDYQTNMLNNDKDYKRLLGR